MSNVIIFGQRCDEHYMKGVSTRKPAIANGSRVR